MRRQWHRRTVSWLSEAMIRFSPSQQNPIRAAQMTYLEAPEAKNTSLLVSYTLEDDPKGNVTLFSLNKPIIVHSSICQVFIIRQRVIGIALFRQFIGYSVNALRQLENFAPATSAAIAVLPFRGTEILPTVIHLSLSTASIAIPHRLHYVSLPAQKPQTAFPS